MPTLVDLINLAIVIVGLTVVVMGLFLTIRIPHFDRWSRSFFKKILFITILYCVSNLTSDISLDFLGNGYAILTKAAIFFESLFSSMLMPLLSVYMLHQSGQGLKSKLFYWSVSLWVIYVALLVFTQFTTYIYYVTPDNVYYRGPYYPVLLVPTIALMIINLMGLYNRRNLLSKKERDSLLVYFLVPAVCMLIQMFSYGIFMIVFGTSVAVTYMFVMILTDQLEKTVEQQVKIREQQLRIQTLQIRPHFIYNTMSNIYYLCEMDPKKAQSVINDFTTYLRNNFGAVAKSGLIPFSQELEHTKAFLAVVKARYEDLLLVEYDTDYTAFRIPPLTLEPIVENAVKHGLDPESAPLYILIKTVQSQGGVHIIVENTGDSSPFSDKPLPSPGSDGDTPPFPGIFNENDEIHLGLFNVSQRLKTLKNGTLTITPKDGGGTVVTIWLPEN